MTRQRRRGKRGSRATLLQVLAAELGAQPKAERPIVDRFRHADGYRAACRSCPWTYGPVPGRRHRDRVAFGHMCATESTTYREDHHAQA